jgi:MFS family permease
MGLGGWQWLFIIEGVPSVPAGLWALRHLTDNPREATWLEPDERIALQESIDHESKSREAIRHYKLGEALTNPRVLGLSLVFFGIVCGVYGLTYWLPQIVKGVAIEIGLDKLTGVSINLLTGYLVAVPFAFAILAMIWWTRHSDVTHERVWHVVCPAVVSGLSLIGAAYLGNLVLAAVALTICAMGYTRPRPLFGINRLNVPRSEIPAVMHVDYSARIQTVHAETNLRYHSLISRFKALTDMESMVSGSGMLCIFRSFRRSF